MASASSNASEQFHRPKRPLGLIDNALKRKHSFIQLFLMTGVMLLSMKSLSQKYHINNLEQDILSLKDEQRSLTDRMSNVKQSLLHEAAKDSTGLFASRLGRLFDEGK
ncbi:hypothetical protein H6P81_017970 [Aristolochia fimbriata]|uniref:Uncharacterized protein n=1 Tax=Aristolochia fimbriata TaxID=158543 RepID=A0AAV7E145_ARIFI|nr:hypothetical protein H6P81_017970 [Aristolochia fimbriata]